MRIVIAAVTPRKRLKSAAIQELLDDYLKRLSRYTPVEAVFFETEAALLGHASSGGSRVPTYLIALDSRGTSLSSEAFATELGCLADAGTQRLMLAIGPADGWSAAARSRANALLSLGPMTFPHELALLILAEQTYRAQTILAGHPYHADH